MSLNITKLDKFFIEQNLIPLKYFTLDRKCLYIELFCTNYAVTFLLYIPTRFQFDLENKENIFKLKYIDVENKEDNLQEQQDIYENNILLNSKHVEENLENNYKSDIIINDTFYKNLISIHKQLKRLSYSVQNIKYKIGIFYKNYICVTRRDNSLNFFSIKHYSKKNKQKIIIIIDLETFFDDIENISSNIQIVTDSIYKILQKNQNSQINLFGEVVENNKYSINDTISKLYNKINEYNILLKDLNIIFEKMILKESNFLDEYENLEKNINNIDKSLKKSHLEKELNSITINKNNIVKNISQLKEKKENLLLNIDKITFDNILMLDRIVKNFKSIKDF